MRPHPIRVRLYNKRKYRLWTAAVHAAGERESMADQRALELIQEERFLEFNRIERARPEQLPLAT